MIKIPFNSIVYSSCLLILKMAVAQMHTLKQFNCVFCFCQFLSVKTGLKFKPSNGKKLVFAGKNANPAWGKCRDEGDHSVASFSTFV